MPKRYRVPRFSQVSLTVLEYGPVSITVRQFTVILLAVMTMFNLWRLFSFLPNIWRLCLTALPGVLLLPFGWFLVAGHSLESWLLILLWYGFQPRVCVWRRDESEQA
ncbi:MAG TPA: hypothetical protein VKR06_01350 [Ktedonosporobacter sp.]|nr:hypothetical protein [Ktedonosporobacter sp.]